MQIKVFLSIATLLFFLPTVSAYAELLPFAGVMSDPDDPDSAMNQPENMEIYLQSEAEDVYIPNAWGTADTSILNINPSDWQVRGSTFNLGLSSDISVGPDTSVSAPIHLPSGALITSVTIYYNDTGVSNPSAGLWCGNVNGGTSIVSNFDPCFPSFDGGNRACTINNINATVDNLACHYGVLLILNAANRMYRMRVNYRLQISPAPLSNTFNDVPVGAPFFGSIEALSASGITGGCGGGNFCPNDLVTRGQMAAFLARALGLHWPD